MATCLVCGNDFEGLTNCPNDGALLLDGNVRVVEGRAGHVVDGRYRIHKQIGKNSLGETFESMHEHRKKPVALKLMRRELSSDNATLKKFLEVAKAASGIKHPNVGRILGIGRAEDKSVYVATEWLKGKTLKQQITAGGPLPADRALAIFEDVITGLDAIHESGVVHGSVRASNIYITPSKNDDDEHVIKVVDLALANVSREIPEEAVYGTAPEQVRGQDPDRRSDFYSAGVLLYHMVTGALPFDAEQTAGVLLMHLEETPAWPSVRFPDLKVPSVIDDLIAKCMAKDPAQRYQTASALQVAIDATTELMEAAAKPAVVAKPEVAEKPEVAAAPEVIEKPEPEAVATPEVIEKPEVVAAPEVAAKPEVVVTPEVIEKPEVVAAPEVAAKPEVVAAPEVAAKPAVAEAPEVVPPPVVYPKPNNTPLIAALVALAIAIGIIIFLLARGN